MVEVDERQKLFVSNTVIAAVLLIVAPWAQRTDFGLWPNLPEPWDARFNYATYVGAALLVVFLLWRYLTAKDQQDS